MDSTSRPPPPAHPAQQHHLSPHSDDEAPPGKKRKARAPRACFPCRQRKVKCSYETPCRTCVAREYPDLCTYDPLFKRPALDPLPGRNLSATAASTPADSSSASLSLRKEIDELHAKLETVEQSVQGLRDDIRQLVSLAQSSSGSGGGVAPLKKLPDRLEDGPPTNNDGDGAIYTNQDLTGDAAYLGCNSVPAMVVALAADNPPDGVKDLLGRSVLPMFGLDNESATYPFVDLWGLPHDSATRLEQISKLLPSNAECLRFFRHYRDTAHVLYPAISDIEQFESELTNFLASRAAARFNPSNDDFANQTLFGKTMHWIGLLFATLASGCQCSELSRRERQLTTQVYVCCAYECLRIVNYLSRSTLHDIQNLLVLGNVLSNNMNAGVAWTLLGLTIRIALSHGLHYPSPSTTPPEIRLLRSNIWWQVIWQDSLLSITYDRTASTETVSHHHPSDLVTSSKMSYAECMRRLCKKGLDIVRERGLLMGSQQQLVRILEYRDKINEIMDMSSDHLRDINACRSIRDQLEHWNLRLHRSYITSELCRPSIMANNPRQQDLLASLRETCIQGLASTVEAFLGLQNITTFARLSWAAVHRSLSCALLLGILKEPSRNERTRELIDSLVEVLSDMTSSVDPSELSGPITRSLAALRKLNVPRSSSQAIWEHKNRLGAAGLSTEGRYGAQNGAGGAMDVADASPSATTSSSPPFLQVGEDRSPYTIMDAIMWGKMQMPEQSNRNHSNAGSKGAQTPRGASAGSSVGLGMGPGAGEAGFGWS